MEQGTTGAKSAGMTIISTAHMLWRRKKGIAREPEPVGFEASSSGEGHGVSSSSI